MLLVSASGRGVVDIDTDDFNVLQSCPTAPIRRRGKKGEARFYRYNPDIRNRAFVGRDKFNKKDSGVDILCEAKYIIVPPSIHPEHRQARQADRPSRF